MLELFEKGGVLLYPLVLFSIVSLSVFLERLWVFSRSRNKRDFFAKIEILVKEQKFDEAAKLAKETAGPVAAIVETALDKKSSGKKVIENAISLKGSYEIQRLKKNLHFLELIGKISPMVGLFGTVVGMVVAFQTMAHAKGAINPSMLAGGIQEALLTTVGGMTVGIPSLIFHHFLKNRLQTISFRMKHHGVEILNLLGGE